MLLVVLWTSGCEQLEPVSMLALDFGPIGAGIVHRTALTLRAEVELRFTPPGGLVELSVDCLAGDLATLDQPDLVGPRFRIDAPAFVFAEPAVARAGYWKLRQDLPAVSTRVHLAVEGGPVTCELRVTPVPTACGAREIFRSAEVGHDHVAVDVEPRADWEAFPVSGQHYATWAPWDQFYGRPIRTGYLLHDLEHGGVVFSYRCASPSLNAECSALANSLRAAKGRFAERRSSITPDPSQPAPFAARAWRWAYLAACYDEEDLLDFANRRFRKGREDVDADPVPSFDPSL